MTAQQPRKLIGYGVMHHTCLCFLNPVYIHCVQYDCTSVDAVGETRVFNGISNENLTPGNSQRADLTSPAVCTRHLVCYLTNMKVLLSVTAVLLALVAFLHAAPMAERSVLSRKWDPLNTDCDNRFGILNSECTGIPMSVGCLITTRAISGWYLPSDMITTAFI